jgi:hypothetical protein
LKKDINLWQYHVIDFPILGKTQSVHIMQKNQKLQQNVQAVAEKSLLMLHVVRNATARSLPKQNKGSYHGGDKKTYKDRS